MLRFSTVIGSHWGVTGTTTCGRWGDFSRLVAVCCSQNGVAMATPYPVLGTNSRVDLEHESVRITVVDNGMQQEIVKVVTVDAVLAICFGTVQKDTTGVATRHRFDWQRGRRLLLAVDLAVCGTDEADEIFTCESGETWAECHLRRMA